MSSDVALSKRVSTESQSDPRRLRLASPIGDPEVGITREFQRSFRDVRLDRVGCFRFEPVAGASANALPDPIPADVKENRWHRFMRAQQEISARKLKAKVGRRIRVLVDETAGRSAKGRST